MENKLCYVCSPYRGDTERNIKYAKELTRLALDNSYVPITPHLYLTQVLDEDDPEQREKGIYPHRKPVRAVGGDACRDKYRHEERTGRTCGDSAWAGSGLRKALMLTKNRERR